MATNESLHHIDQENYLPTFNRFPLAIDRGEGCYLYDVEGNKYLDMLAGIAVNNVGHCHPKVVRAIQEQAAKLMHISNFFVSEPQVSLSEKLTQLSGLDRVFLTNSGAESLEGAIKVARKYAHSIGKGGEIVAFENSFHGRTLATIATGSKKYQQGFDPIPSGFKNVPFNDMEAVLAATDENTAAIMIEPIQGEGGINVADKQFLIGLREYCNKNNILLIFDEVQCGVGRTGHWFAKDHFGVQPDIMTLAKGLGGGVPIGAILTNEKVSKAINFGDHGTTFGGNPLVCAAALAVIDTIQEEKLLDNARNMGEELRNRLAAMGMHGVKEIRGVGLMLGVEFTFETKPVVLEMLKHGVIANATAGHVLRMVPPLTIERKDLEVFTDALQLSLKNMEANV